jgi:hypothetical protein
MQVYLNGQYIDAAEARVSVWDGGYLYGDGIYTTLRLYAGRPLDLPAHLERLRRHAAALELPVPLSDEQTGTIIEALVAANGLRDHDGRLRITISRGGDPDDPLPLRDLGRLTPTVLFTLAPVPASLAEWAQGGITGLSSGAGLGARQPAPPQDAQRPARTAGAAPGRRPRLPGSDPRQRGRAPARRRRQQPVPGEGRLPGDTRRRRGPAGRAHARARARIGRGAGPGVRAAAPAAR